MASAPDTLPDEVLLLAFGYLTTPRDLFAVLGVCRAWRRVASDYSLWRDVALRPNLAMRVTAHHTALRFTLAVNGLAELEAVIKADAETKARLRAGCGALLINITSAELQTDTNDIKMKALLATMGGDGSNVHVIWDIGSINNPSIPKMCQQRFDLTTLMLPAIIVKLSHLAEPFPNLRTLSVRNILSLHVVPLASLEELRCESLPKINLATTFPRVRKLTLHRATPIEASFATQLTDLVLNLDLTADDDALLRLLAGTFPCLTSLTVRVSYLFGDEFLSAEAVVAAYQLAVRTPTLHTLDLRHLLAPPPLSDLMPALKDGTNLTRLIMTVRSDFMEFGMLSDAKHPCEMLLGALDEPTPRWHAFMQAHAAARAEKRPVEFAGSPLLQVAGWWRGWQVLSERTALDTMVMLRRGLSRVRD